MTKSVATSVVGPENSQIHKFTLFSHFSPEKCEKRETKSVNAKCAEKCDPFSICEEKCAEKCDGLRSSKPTNRKSVTDLRHSKPKKSYRPQIRRGFQTEKTLRPQVLRSSFASIECSPPNSRRQWCLRLRMDQIPLWDVSMAKLAH